MIACILLNAVVNILVVLFMGGKLIFLIILKYYKLLDRSHDNLCQWLLKKFYFSNSDGAPSGWTPRNLDVLNTFDPFRAELSCSDQD